MAGDAGHGEPGGAHVVDTVWPFFFLAVVFLALEAVALIAAREGRSLAPVKDAVFVALYAVLLINAVPGEAG